MRLDGVSVSGATAQSLADLPLEKFPGDEKNMKYFSKLTAGVLLDEVPGIRGQVGRKVQFPLQYFLYGSLPVLGSEGRGSSQHVVHQSSQGPPVHGLPVARPGYNSSSFLGFYTGIFCLVRRNLNVKLRLSHLVRISGAMYSMVPQKV